MNGDYGESWPGNTLGRSGSRDSDDGRNDNGQKAITSRDIDALVQLKALRKAL
ncbi:hypothetical protein [Mycobacterium genavense]|uniref:hypothetical protein n=1 Tax=Mycobacterium genavense TaxID=36812 RepID=UPI0004B9C296|nr:hypothetical protein [Mycobacterium genavense]